MDDLHESVVGRILSFLPTTEAVRTSVLSKAWKYKWTAINDIRFDHRSLYWEPQFMEFVERVFLAIGNSQLRRFHFQSDVSEAFEDQFGWILRILGRNLEELKLSLRVTIELSPSCPLSKLKTLDLRRVKIVTDESSPFVLHCPSLRSLTLACCQWINFTKITINSPLLETLQIEDCSYNNETSSVHESKYCSFNVMTQYLKEFQYIGAFYEEFHLSNPLSVVCASIRFTTWTGQNPRRHHYGFALLKGLLNLKYLKLEVPSGALGFLDNLPVFSKLTHLELILENIIKNPLGKFLTNLPVLETLSLCSSSSHHRRWRRR